MLAYLDRLAGRNPLDRVTGAPGSARSPGSGGGPVPSGTGHPGHPGLPPAAPGDDPGPGTGPVPAVINLLVPAGTLLGWSAAPGDAGGWGLLDPGDTRALVRAASRHPATRWAVTVIGPDGTATAHGRARGPRPWTPPPPPGSPPPRGPSVRGRAGPAPPPGPAAPGPHQREALRQLLRALNVTFTPIAKGRCDHRGREDRYTPGRALKDLVRARTAICPAPGCGAQAVYCDLDHTTAYPVGPTCQCDLGPPCRHHHRAKQAPGWRLDQPEPGVMRWTTPSGRVHTTTPTVYDT